MGIHRFFPWFKQNFGKHLKDVKMPSDSVNTSVDNFMIDLNGIFHTSAQRIYKYGNFKQAKRLISNNNKSYQNKDHEIFKDVCVEIDRLIKYIQPKKCLYLAVDGVAPICKQAQQRQRRYKSAYESFSDNAEFDSCTISPGTVFMHNLTKYIHNFIREKMNNDAIWRTFNVIFSSEKTPSEGEQKCLQFVRKNKVKNPNDTYCIHGMDADLIMLGLSAHVKQFYILRENIYESGFHLIDITAVSTDLANLMKWKNESVKKFNQDRAVDDFVYICFVVGNDFLPNIPSIEIVEGGIDVMLEVYRKVGENYGHLTRSLNTGIYFVKKPFETFIGEIGSFEKGLIEEKMNNINITFYPDPIVDRNLYMDKETCTKKLNYDAYKADYYKTNFNADSEDKIKEICIEYIEGMQWVLKYYNKCIPCWNWCYKYNHAPFASDMAKYVKDFRFVSYKKSTPNDPFQQLLSIMSPKSSTLVPYPLNTLMLHKSSPIKEFYPENFTIELAGKRKAWEGKAILPIMDQDKLKKAYKSLIREVDQSISHLNCNLNETLFTIKNNELVETEVN